MAELQTLTTIEEPQSETITVTEEPCSHEGGQLVLRLHKPKSEKKVQWGEEVVDNELLGRKSSKCCCIYTKPYHNIGDSDNDESDDDDCCHEHKVGRGHIPHKHNDKQQ